MNNTLINIITDWNSDSLYWSIVKSEIYSINANIKIVNSVSVDASFDYLMSAFILRNSYYKYPKATIHLNFAINTNVVNPDAILAYVDEQFIICRDDGFLSILLGNKNVKLYRLKVENNSFSILKAYIQLVKLIINRDLGKLAQSNNYLKQRTFEPFVRKDIIFANVLYIDNYGSLITNITKDYFYSNCKTQNFKIIFDTAADVVSSISENYSDVEEGSVLALFNYLGLLEIAMRDANLAKLISFSKTTQIRIIMENDAESESSISSKTSVPKPATNNDSGYVQKKLF